MLSQTSQIQGARAFASNRSRRSSALHCLQRRSQQSSGSIGDIPDGASSIGDCGEPHVLLISGRKSEGPSERWQCNLAACSAPLPEAHLALRGNPEHSAMSPGPAPTPYCVHRCRGSANKSLTVHAEDDARIESMSANTGFAPMYIATRRYSIAVATRIGRMPMAPSA